MKVAMLLVFLLTINESTFARGRIASVFREAATSNVPAKQIRATVDVTARKQVSFQTKTFKLGRMQDGTEVRAPLRAPQQNVKTIGGVRNGEHRFYQPFDRNGNPIAKEGTAFSKSPRTSGNK